uniref:Uncharacterized protein n=1 Tax=Cacopsylla melanoneura TaxID=428564 RepID=A0A8D8QM82_9HEMI
MRLLNAESLQILYRYLQKPVTIWNLKLEEHFFTFFLPKIPSDSSETGNIRNYLGRYFFLSLFSLTCESETVLPDDLKIFPWTTKNPLVFLKIPLNIFIYFYFTCLPLYFRVVQSPQFSYNGEWS